jgi:uncharacterized membrane protein required for colicin V production
MVETILTIFAILVILYLGRVGASFGMFFEMTSTVFFFFAMLVTMRYWHQATQIFNSIVPFGNAYAAFWGFLLLFILGCLPLLWVLKNVNDESRPKYPEILDTVLGFVFGALSSGIVICCVFTLMSVIVPKAWADYDPSNSFLRLDRVPIATMRFIESTFFGIGEADPARTRLPTLEKSDLDDFEKFWQ